MSYNLYILLRKKLWLAHKKQTGLSLCLDIFFQKNIVEEDDAFSYNSINDN